MERSFQSPGLEAADSADAVRKRVMTAAADLFATRGFAGTSISEIRKASGASASSIYWEFGSKNGILRAVLEDSANRWLDQAAESHARAREDARRSGRDPVEANFAHLATELTERPEFLRMLLLLALEQREGEPETLEAIRRVRTRATAGFARGFREMQFVADEVPDEQLHEIAMASLAFTDGAFIAAQIDPGRVDLRRLFAIFHAGLAAALQVEGHRTRPQGSDISEGEPR
jgi:AcrR family transcriptional regulator